MLAARHRLDDVHAPFVDLRPRCRAAVLLSAPVLSPAIAANARRAERRCGWYENPTPGNVTLTDRDGTWIIAMQGGHEAKGDGPEFSATRNGS